MNEAGAQTEALAWLLGIGPVTPSSCPPSLVEAAERFALRCWRVLPIVAPRLRAWTGVPTPLILEERLHAIRRQAELQAVLCGRLTQRLEQRGIPYALLKGSAVKGLAYEHMHQRASFDIDVGVHPSSVQAALHVAEEIEFQKAQWDDAARQFIEPDLWLREVVERDHFELGYLVRRQRVTYDSEEERRLLEAQCRPDQLSWNRTPDGGIACNLAVDIHHGLNERIPTDIIIDHATRVTRDGQRYWVTCPAGAMLHLVYKLYAEGLAWGKGMYQYADCARLVELLDEPQTRLLGSWLERFGMLRQAYYVLRRLPMSFGTPLPDPVRALVDHASRYPDRDWSDMWQPLCEQTETE